MRIILYIFLLISLIVTISNAEEKPMILRNNYYENPDHTCITLKATMEIFPECSYYNDFDTIKYSNKTLGFIIKDLSNKFVLLKSRSYSGWEKLNKEDYLTRSHFTFIFKKDDTTAIHINGCLAYDKIIKEKNDSIAMEHLLLQDSFILEAIQFNIKKRCLHLIEMSLTDESIILKENIQFYQNYFPEACK